MMLNKTIRQYLRAFFLYNCLLVLCIINIYCGKPVISGSYHGKFSDIYLSDSGYFIYHQPVTGLSKNSSGSWTQIENNKIFLRSDRQRDSVNVSLSKNLDLKNIVDSIFNVSIIINSDIELRDFSEFKLFIADSIKIILEKYFENKLQLSSKLLNKSFYLQLTLDRRVISCAQCNYNTFKQGLEDGISQVNIRFDYKDIDFLMIKDTAIIKNNKLYSNNLEIMVKKH